MTIATKGNIGEQDIVRWEGTSGQTFSRVSSTGGTVTLNKIGHEVDALITYGNGSVYTNATITKALSKIGTSQKATLILRNGTWTFSSNIDWSSYSNVVFKFAPGALISHGAYTIALPTNSPIDAGEYQIFSGTGSVTFGGDRDSTWFGTVNDGDTGSATANTAAIQQALTSFGTTGGNLRIPKNTKFTLSSLTFVARQNLEYWIDDDISTSNTTLATNQKVILMANAVATASYGITNETRFTAPFHPGVIVDVRKDITGHDSYLGSGQSRTNPARGSFIISDEELAHFLIQHLNYPDDSNLAANGAVITPYRWVLTLTSIVSGNFSVAPQKGTLITGGTSGFKGIFQDFSGTGSAMRVVWVSGVPVVGETVSYTLVELSSIVTADFTNSAPSAGEKIYGATSTAVGSFIDFGGTSSAMRVGLKGGTFAVGEQIYDADDKNTTVTTGVTTSTITSSTTISVACTYPTTMTYQHAATPIVWDRTTGGYIGLGLYHAEEPVSVAGRIGIQKTQAAGQLIPETITNPGIVIADNLSIPVQRRAILLNADNSRLSVYAFDKTTVKSHLEAVAAHGRVAVSTLAVSSSRFNFETPAVKNGTGDYSLTYTTALSRNDPSIAVSVWDADCSWYVHTANTTTVRLIFRSIGAAPAAKDPTYFSVTVFGGDI